MELKPRTGVEYISKIIEIQRENLKSTEFKMVNSKPRKRKNEYPKRGGKGSGPPKSNGAKSEHISVLFSV